MTPARWRSAALGALWALVAATLGLAAYTLWRDQPLTDLGVMQALRALLAAVVLAWWTQVFARYTAGVATPPGDGTGRALRLVFPWLTALRLSLWGLTALSVVGAPNLPFNSVALTALLTVELGFILAKNAVYGTLARFADAPESALGRARLGQWLNTAAALSLALGVVNVVPLAGAGGWSWEAAGVYGLHAALDVLSGVLALRAVQATAPARPPE